MAEVLGILGGIYTSAQILDHLATHTKKWRLLSEQLFDIKHDLFVAARTLERWKTTYDYQKRRPIIYMQVLFGRAGWREIQEILGVIQTVTDAIQSDVNRAVGRALAARPGVRNPGYTSDKYDKLLVEDCLQRIKRNMSWSRTFKYAVLGRADDLQRQIDRLYRNLGALERLSDLCLEREQPETYHHIKRLVGKRVILTISDSHHDIVKSKLLDALSARKDADLLHRASSPDPRIHIGLSVPQIHRRDFAFLLPQGQDRRAQEILAHPVKFKEINNKNKVQPSIEKAVPILKNAKESFLLPSSNTLNGFQLSIPPSNLFVNMDSKQPISKLIRPENAFLGQQALHVPDQIALACGIAQGSFRLIGSRWLTCLDNENIRWRKTAEGKWTIMMDALPGDRSTTRTLNTVIDTKLKSRGNRDLSKHTHIFRIGLVLTELILKMPISQIDFDETNDRVRIYIFSLDDRAMCALDIAAEVDNRAGILLGNVVYWCLSSLEREGMRERDIEEVYFREVLSQAEKLESLVNQNKNRGTPVGSGAGTPRSRDD